jgi:hypothetical protein
MSKKYICNGIDICGVLAKECRHGKPHIVTRCGDCGTWCGDSNGFCNEGSCSGKPQYKTIFHKVCEKHCRPACNIEHIPTKQCPHKPEINCLTDETCEDCLHHTEAEE